MKNVFYTYRIRFKQVDKYQTLFLFYSEKSNQQVNNQTNRSTENMSKLKKKISLKKIENQNSCSKFNIILFGPDRVVFSLKLRQNMNLNNPRTKVTFYIVSHFPFMFLLRNNRMLT